MSPLLAAVLLLSSSPVVAQPAKFQPPAEMLAKMKKAAAPGPEHDALKPFVGEWAVQTTVWPGPGAPPLVFEGSAVKVWTLGGRFLQENLTSAGPDGRPLHGLGFLGFDRGLKRYQGVYMATDRTGMVRYSGIVAAGAAAGQRVFTYEGVEADPLGAGPPMKFKMVVNVEGPQRHTLTQFYLVPGMGEVRAFRMVHTRKAASAKKP